MSASPWLISRRADLTWFFGAVLPALALLLLFRLAPPLTDDTYGLGHPALWLLLLWGVFFDGTHVLGSYARTYLAPVADRESRRALPSPWAFLIVPLGPALALLDGLFLPQRPSLLGHAGALFQHFLLFAYLWAYYHLVRQHWGFLVLYQRRLAQPIGSRVDAWLLGLGCLYPYLRFALSEAGQKSGLPLPLPPSLIPLARLALDAALAIGLVATVPSLVRRLRQQPAGPRELFLLLVLGFHALTFAALDHLLSITAVLTMFHNLQYHRIVWQYEQGKGRRPLGSTALYLGAGVLLGLLWYGPRIAGVALVPPSLWRNALLGFGWCVAFHHYLIDGRIWRVRKSPALAQALDRGAGLARTQA
ncbi:MAG: hypothetical protein JNJ46_25870 [Myxococcales bacterium]|nr:hypothetical protein [Myxococcales bacterium]